MIGLYGKLVAAAVIATALAGSHWKAYVSGKNTVHAEWNAQKLVESAAALKAVAEARIREQALQTNVDKAVQNAKVRETKLKADAVAASAAAYGLQDAAARALSRAKDSHDSCIISATRLDDVFGSCRKEYGALAEDAGQWQSRAVELQDAWPK